MSQVTHQNNNKEELHTPLEWPELLGRWVVVLVSIPLQFISSVVVQFLKSNGAGTPVLGFVALAIGTTISADSIWQALFQGTPLFIFYEKSWIGWQGWIGLLWNVFFWAAILIAYLVIRVESWTLRGVSPDRAKQEYQDSMKYELPKKPQGRIDLAGVLWKRYKRAGTGKYRNMGLIAWTFWSADIISTFVSRWPWRYENPQDILGCLGYNLFALVVGEVCFEIHRGLKAESAKKGNPTPAK